MKDKEPDNLFFSADESPVPLPSLEEAWSDMRKKLDEEMPERALFFTRKRTGLLSILLLLSIGAFWFIERRGVGEGTVRKGAMPVVRDSMESTAGNSKRPARSDDRQERTGVAAETEKADERKAEQAVEGGQIENAPAMRLKTKTDEVQTEKAEDARKTGKITKEAQRENVVNRQNEKTVGIGIKWKDMHRQEGDRQDQQQAGPVTNRQLTTTVVADLSRPGRDSILVWVTMPKRATGIVRKVTGKEKKNADQPGKTKKVVPDDSTRILWAAGLQDSKSFPVGAQQPVDYNANLKKDLWFDYVPAPYFQFFISRKIGFQVALQFNNPQYTEAVSIFKKKGTVTGSFSNDTDIVVRKLYYLSIPLTVYYSPIRNLYLGAGLQFSNLSNGVALQNNVIHYVGAGSGQPDTVTGIKLITLKEYRPAYSNLKRTDWRALFEMNYYWKRTTLGIQYQQGLSDYLYTPVDGSTGKDKNSSFNVYFRYNLWERRIRIATR